MKKTFHILSSAFCLLAVLITFKLSKPLVDAIYSLSQTSSVLSKTELYQELGYWNQQKSKILNKAELYNAREDWQHELIKTTTMIGSQYGLTWRKMPIHHQYISNHNKTYTLDLNYHGDLKSQLQFLHQIENEHPNLNIKSLKYSTFKHNKNTSLSGEYIFQFKQLVK